VHANVHQEDPQTGQAGRLNALPRNKDFPNSVQPATTRAAMMMDEPDFSSILGPALAGALEQKGYKQLTPVQQSVLSEAVAGRDLRITSQTGSGKTLAIGFALRDLVGGATKQKGGMARPVALVVAPTRELARQVEQELAWFYAPLNAKVASATGGADYRDERRALAVGPALVVGTPGRLLDHLGRGSIDPSQLGAIVLDEADRMLDLGFREELEAILAYAPAGHRTHLISATFPPGVRSLADRVQVDPVRVEGTPLGAANADIDHVVYLVDPSERVNAIINLLLANPDEQMLIFARTRIDVARIARELKEGGFAAGSISGEMEQPERNRALAEFKRGTLRALVATDVAARGIDVQDIARVIHADPPDDADSYTHRSGRTGRAGRKGTSSVLISPSALARTSILLKRARVTFRIEPIPTAADILKARDERIYNELVAADPEGFAGHDERLSRLAERLATSGDVKRTLARLLARTPFAGTMQPRQVRTFSKPAPSSAPERGKFSNAPERGKFSSAPERGKFSSAPDRAKPHRAGDAPHSSPPRSGTFVPFRVSWGKTQGADARRLLAMICRRGGVRSGDVGAIRIARGFSIVEIGTGVADSFAEAAGKPDPRDPRIVIARDTSDGEAPFTHEPAERRPMPAGTVRRPARPRERRALP
jgi:ATP-dependent RNA helicase DeaD